MDGEAPYEDCTTGADMKYYGTLLVTISELTNASGNLIIQSWVDYDAFDGVTLKNMDTQEVWTCISGHNPFGEVIKENGFYVLHYHWNELYRSGDGDMLHILLKGHVKIDKDGNVTIDRESYTCR
jgi:hypothetical protein